MALIWPKQKQYCATFLVVWVALYMLSCHWVVKGLAVGFFSLYVADLVLKIHEEFFKEKTYIKDNEKKAVFITGCDSGFGNKLAQRLANMGFTVFAGCLYPEGSGAKELEKDKKIVVIKLDVVEQCDIENAVQVVKEYLDKSGLKLWSIVNNAGIALGGEVELLTMSTYRRVLEVNSLAPVAVTKAFLPLLRQAREGRVVNVASIAGRYTMYGLTAYCMSKHAVVAFSDGLRIEMKKWNISVHTIELVLYKTNICSLDALRLNDAKVWQEAPEEAKEAYGKDFFDVRCAAHCAFVEAISRAPEKIHEVVDDLVDAVASEAPKIRYLPSLSNKIFHRIMNQMPFEIQHWHFSRYCQALTPAKASVNSLQAP